MSGIPLLEVLDDAQRVQIVIEAAAMAAKALVQRTLSGMTEGRVSYIVYKSERLGEILIKPKDSSGSAGDLRDLHRMRQAAAKVVGGAAGKYLRLARETAKGACLHNPLAVALKSGAGWP